MSKWLKSLWQATRLCADALISLVCWTLWLALVVLLGLQIAIATSHEFAVPAWMLRSIEERFTASHVTARFGRATFDPTGRVLIENLRLSLPEFSEPVATVRAVFLELDPWSLLAGQVSAHRIHATGVNFSVPAMLAPSGRNEELLSDLDLVLVPTHQHFAIENLTARVAGVALTAHGELQVARSAITGPVKPLPLLDNLASHYADFSRQLIRVAEKLAAFDQPSLAAQLTPSATRGAIATVRLMARGVSYPEYKQLHADGIDAAASFPLLGDAPALSAVSLTVEEVHADEVYARNVHGSLRGILNPKLFFYSPNAVELTASEVSARGFTLRNPILTGAPDQLPLIDALVLAESEGVPLTVNAHANIVDKTAALHVVGGLSPNLLTPISEQLHKDVRRFIGFGQPVRIDADVTFTEGWKFRDITGYIWAQDVDAYGVPIDSAEGHIDFDGRHFLASRARARLGENFARGSFEQDLKTKEFRFLLEGRLRPLAIKGWFREWWPDFFEHFEFPTEPPAASVDVAGRWFSGWQTTVFVFAEANTASIRGAQLDYARTRMFIRPNFFDGLELVARRGAGGAQGTFTRTLETRTNEWKELTLDFDSTLDLDTGAKLLGPTIGKHLADYTFKQSPAVKVAGRFNGPGSTEGENFALRIEAKSTGEFTAFKFPGKDLSFTATLTEDELVLDPLECRVADGVVAGRAKLSGSGNQKRLGIDASVKGARFGPAVAAVTHFAAARRGQPEPPTEKFLSSKNNAILNLTLAAEGRFEDLYSYHGRGHASLTGAELGEIRLLGLLSQLLNFTALRFTAATAEFSVDGRKLTFPSVSVTGANSAIQAHGEYALDRRQLDFNARVYPFQESKSFIQNVVGTMLAPLSAVFEVKLTGSLDQANWAFVIGPTNFFRSFSQPDEPPAPPPPAAANPSTSAEPKP